VQYNRPNSDEAKLFSTLKLQSVDPQFANLKPEEQNVSIPTKIPLLPQIPATGQRPDSRIACLNQYTGQAFRESK
jgi:hypothetical protein